MRVCSITDAVKRLSDLRFLGISWKDGRFSDETSFVVFFKYEVSENRSDEKGLPYKKEKETVQ